MPSFSTSLEQAIHQALALANEHRHELATLEHLLLALTEEPDAVKVMRACNVDLEDLRKTLVDFIEDRDVVRPGDRVVTTGDGGVFPADLLVGQVVLGSDGMMRLRLSADYERLEFLRVLRSRPVERLENAGELVFQTPQAFVPPDPKDDVQINYALDLLRGIKQHAMFPPDPSQGIPN